PDTVGAFLPEDFGALDKARIVYDEGAALSTGHVLSFMETLARQRSKRAQIPMIVLAEESVRVVLDDRDPVVLAEGADRIHFAPDARVMDRDDGFGSGSDRARKQRRVNIERIGADVDEYRHGPS